MRKKLKKGGEYLFEWNDTYSNHGWFTEDELDDKTIANLQQSIGHLIKETDIWYLIAVHKNTNPHYKPWGDVNWIPKGCVTSVRKL